MDIVGQLPQHPTKRYETRDLTAIDALVLHHSVTPPEITPLDIALYHINPHGPNKEEWPGIGYHFVLTADGTLYQTQRLETMSYHVASRNRTSVGLCVVGDFTKDEPTEAQKAMLPEAILYIMDLIPAGFYAPHKDYALPEYPTTCPGRLMEWL